MVPRLRMTGGTDVHLLCAILLWTGTTLHLPLVNTTLYGMDVSFSHTSYNFTSNRREGC